jgi:hypothetical protein
MDLNKMWWLANRIGIPDFFGRVWCEMSYVKSVVVVAILVFCLSSPGFASELGVSLQRHASLEAPRMAPEPRAQEESLVLGWLEDLLTRVPFEEAIDSTATRGHEDSLQRELEESVATQAPQQTEEPVDPFFPKPRSIPPLYTSPVLEGEGVWTEEDLPVSQDGRPLVYKTVYRPSEEFPTSIVHMALFDMSRLKSRFFVGQTEPGVYQVSRTVEHENLSKIVAITNAMWMQQHAKGAGAIFRGQVIYPMVPGMATLVIYRDDSVDVLEWTDDIPLHLVSDARQLRHLMVKDGAVVEQIYKNGKISDSEIGLGGFLIDDNGRSTMNNKFWFLANRTAFGIRDDGNLVFAMGHHVSTRDLAKALVLAGCKRAIHGDANIHNIVCNFYFRDSRDKIVKREKLSPDQLKYTLTRYDQGYTKDFFAFYEK